MISYTRVSMCGGLVCIRMAKKIQQDAKGLCDLNYISEPWYTLEEEYCCMLIHEKIMNAVCIK